MKILKLYPKVNKTTFKVTKKIINKMLFKSIYYINQKNRNEICENTITLKNKK